MAMQSFPFTSEVTFDDSGFPQFDRAVGSDVLRSILSNYYTNGVFGIGNNNSFKVVAAAGGGMSLTVQPGACLINGATGYNTEETRITLANGEAQPRIDSIVLRLDDNKAQRSIRVEVIKGTPQSQPVKPTPVREGAVYDLVLANVMVKANASTITNADITDTRLDKNLCGFVNAINNLNLGTIYMQQITMFNDWFEGIKGQLSTDAAGNLQNQINALKPKVDAVNNALDFNGQNTTTKGPLEVTGKLSAKGGLVISDDTFLVKRLNGVGARPTLNAAIGDKEDVRITVTTPDGYKAIGVIQAYSDFRASVSLYNFVNNVAYCSVFNSSGWVGVSTVVSIDVLYVRCK
jgi:conserved domain protein|nr:MAG TPA: Receptor Binding Protein [Bacteriophage sp.]